MTKGTLSLTFLMAGLLGGIVVVADLWIKNAPPAIPSAQAAAQAATPPTIDGTIASGEYANTFHDDATAMDLHWTVVGDLIYIGLHSPGKGWLALGLAPDGPAMKGADILIGYVSDGDLTLSDQFADSPYTHKPDTDLGGTNDITASAGSEDDSGTTIEFSRPLNTGDSEDKVIIPGEMTVMLAYSDTDDLTTYHKQRDEAQVTFVSENGEAP